MTLTELNEQIQNCDKCLLCKASMNQQDVSKGTGKLIGYYKDFYEGKCMIIGANPSYRRYPGIYQAFGGEVLHSGTGNDFIDILRSMNLLDKIYLTNAVKCSTMEHRILPNIYRTCFERLLKEIEIVKLLV